MNTDRKTNLSDIPLEVLIEEVESRKISEVKILIAQTNANIKKLKTITGSYPYNKNLYKEDRDRWELIQLGVNVKNNKIIDIYYEDIKIEEE